MEWLLLNWFWILIFILFCTMHMFGHGGHGGHGGGNRQRGKDEEENDEAQGRVVNKSSRSSALSS